jgi:hypothetical protein
MNFQELMQRMAELDRPVSEESTVEDVGVEECGMMPAMSSMSPMEDKPQQDTVTMNVSMNGNGAGGIADLMAILRNIEEKGEADDEPMIAIGGGDDMSAAQGDIDGDGDHDMDDHDMEKDDLMGQKAEMDEFANEPDEMYKDISAVTQTGGDIHSKGGEAPKVNGGGNPLLKVKVEGILEQLTSLYKEVKLR